MEKLRAHHGKPGWAQLSWGCKLEFNCLIDFDWFCWFAGPAAGIAAGPAAGAANWICKLGLDFDWFWLILVDVWLIWNKLNMFPSSLDLFPNSVGLCPSSLGLFPNSLSLFPNSLGLQTEFGCSLMLLYVDYLFNWFWLNLAQNQSSPQSQSRNTFQLTSISNPCNEITLLAVPSLLAASMLN